jgi:hypothetical protein
MSRAAESRKTKSQLRELSLDELTAEIRYLKQREAIAGTSIARKLCRKFREVAERVRDEKFGAQ